MELKEKLEKLASFLVPLPGLSVALSGGLDSSVLLWLAKEILGQNRVEALTILSPIMEPSSLWKARLVSSKAGVKHRLVPFDHLSLKTFRQNPPDRCYFCKKAMFENLRRLCTYPLADGTQQDDLREDRPGLRALAELKVLSPLKEAGLIKEEIRYLARRFGFWFYKHPSAPCLATRFIPGEEITREKITLLRKAEALLTSEGFSKVRVRLTNGLALIEVEPTEVERLISLRKEIVSRLISHY